MRQLRCFRAASRVPAASTSQGGLRGRATQVHKLTSYHTRSAKYLTEPSIPSLVFAHSSSRALECIVRFAARGASCSATELLFICQQLTACQLAVLGKTCCDGDRLSGWEVGHFEVKLTLKLPASRPGQACALPGAGALVRACDKGQPRTAAAVHIAYGRCSTEPSCPTCLLTTLPPGQQHQQAYISDE